MSARAPAPASPDDAAPVHTVGAMRAVMRDEIILGLSIIAEEIKKPALCTTAEIATELRVSERTVYTLRGEGLPHLMIGDSPRFVLAEVLAWLKAGRK